MTLTKKDREESKIWCAWHALALAVDLHLEAWKHHLSSITWAASPSPTPEILTLLVWGRARPWKRFPASQSQCLRKLEILLNAQAWFIALKPAESGSSSRRDFPPILSCDQSYNKLPLAADIPSLPQSPGGCTELYVSCAQRPKAWSGTRPLIFVGSEPATLPAAKEGQESPQRVLLSGIQGDFNDRPVHDCAGGWLSL